MPSKHNNALGDSYHSIAESGHFELKVKRSRFIAHAFPVESPSQCNATLDELRRRFHDAKHVCFAYRLRQQTQIILRSSDDGEPAGTAGAPMGQVLTGLGLVNVLVAVVRYFGGVKLGPGGLVRAYTESVQSVLASLPVVRHDVSRSFRISCTYAYLNSILRALEQAGAGVREKSFSQEVLLWVDIPVRKIAGLERDLAELAAGAIKLEPCKGDSE